MTADSENLGEISYGELDVMLNSLLSANKIYSYSRSIFQSAGQIPSNPEEAPEKQ